MGELRVAFCLGSSAYLRSHTPKVLPYLTSTRPFFPRLTRKGSQRIYSTSMTTNVAKVVESDGAASRVREAGERLFRGSSPPTVISVLGGPGSGKGTLSATLASRLGYMHLSAGDLLREASHENSEEGEMIQGMLARGEIVPSVVTVGIVYKKIEELLRKKDTDMPWRRAVLIDGFPRNLDNLLAWERTGGMFEAVLSIVCDDEVMMQRLRKRSSNSTRSDDNETVIPKRIETHRKEFGAIERYYTAKNILMGVDGHASPRNVVTQATRKLRYVEEEMLLNVNMRLLNAISEKDYVTYEMLVDKEMTCFEPEAAGYQIGGKEFHKYYFGLSSFEATKSNTSIVNSKVRVMGDAAVVSYVRLIQRETQTDAFEETRVWERKREAGNIWWKCVHFHRSKVNRS